MKQFMHDFHEAKAQTTACYFYPCVNQEFFAKSH